MTATDNINIQGEQDNNLFNFQSQGHLCKYYEIEDFQNKIKDSNKSFSTLSLNVRSLKGKWAEFNELISELNFDQFKFSVIGIQEVWSLPPAFNTEIKGYKPLIYKLRSSEPDKTRNIGGGIALWVRDIFEVELLENISVFEEKNFESIFVKVYTSKKEFKIIGNIYRAPGTNIKEFNKILNSTLDSISKDKTLKKANEIQLIGDFNINLIQYETHVPTNEYLNTLLCHGQLPMITLPTRITPVSSTLIDHISTNLKHDFYDNGIIYSCLSDHMPVFHISHDTDVISESNSSFIKIRKSNASNINNFKDKLNRDWSDVTSEKNPETAFNKFSDFIDAAYEESFPVRTVKCRKDLNPIKPFMTSAILVSRKTKNKLAAKRLKHPTPENISKYKEYNDMYRSLIRKSKILFYKNKFNEYSTNMKKTWSLIKDIIGAKSTKREMPDVFLEDGKIYSGESEIADGFNEFFSNVGKNLADAIPDPGENFLRYLGDPVNENFIFAKITSQMVLETVSLLKPKNSSGIDKISTKLLKDIMLQIVDPIVYLFNLSLTTGFIPDNYKYAKVIPIYKLKTYKIEETTTFTNYRPISLLSSFSKVLEKIVARQMFRYLNKFKILYDHQYGFRPKHNTNHPLLQFLDKIYTALNNPGIYGGGIL